MEERLPLCLPHEAPIRMIDGLDEVKDGRFASHVTVPRESPYVENGRLCPEALLEVMAQCFAAGMACRAGFRGEKALGYLAAVRNFEVSTLVRSGERLTAQCALLMRVGAIWVAEGRVLLRGEPVARAQLKIFIPES